MAAFGTWREILTDYFHGTSCLSSRARYHGFCIGRTQLRYPLFVGANPVSRLRRNALEARSSFASSADARYPRRYIVACKLLLYCILCLVAIMPIILKMRIKHFAIWLERELAVDLSFPCVPFSRAAVVKWNLTRRQKLFTPKSHLFDLTRERNRLCSITWCTFLNAEVMNRRMRGPLCILCNYAEFSRVAVSSKVYIIGMSIYVHLCFFFRKNNFNLTGCSCRAKLPRITCFPQLCANNYASSLFKILIF